MHDAHVHLDFMENGEQVAADALAAGVGLFATTVTPEGYVAAQKRFEAFDNVHVGWGMHPWWVDAAVQRPPLVVPPDERFVGEVGLDFSKRRVASRDAQLEAFRNIVTSCADQGGKIISIHSVHAAREVLDMLEAYGTLECCACIFHWYSGPSDQLKRAIDAGCYFSIGPRMVETRKGREYVKAIPARQMLLETDAPPTQGAPYSFDELSEQLAIATRMIATVKSEGVLDIIENTFKNLFGCIR